MAAFAAAPFRGHGLSSVVVSTTFGATNRLPSIVESRYAGDYIPKFQAEFGVSEEEPDGPWVGLPSDPLTTPPPSPVPTPDNRLIRIAHRTKLIVIMTSLQRSAIWTPLLT
jgi:hypothetical protein